jgi:hypothetical protein
MTDLYVFVIKGYIKVIRWEKKEKKIIRKIKSVMR